MATQTQSFPGPAFERCNPCSTFDKQKVVPVVSHIVTDEDIGLVQETRSQRISLPKVVKLLTDPHSVGLHDRHVQALKKVIKHYSDGFLMKELVLVFRILNACADEVAAVPAYVEPMSDLLRLCGLSHLKEKVSDEAVYEQIAVECIEQFGYLMRVSSSRLRLQICDTLRTFYCHPPKSHKLLDNKYKPNSVSYNQRIVNKSNVAETLVKSLALVENDFDVKMAILDLLQRLSRNSPTNCTRMLDANCAYRLCSRLMDYDPTHQLVFQSVEILWNLLDHCGSTSDELAKQLNNVLCISQLRDAFIYQLVQGFSHFDRQLRNDLLVIISCIGSKCPEVPLIQVGFVKQLAILASFQEVKSHNVLVKHLKLAPNHEDFELKKLLINLVVILSRDPAVLPIFSESHVLLALFSYVRLNEKVGAQLTLPSHDWTAAQFEEIQLGAIAALSTLAPLMIEDYMACQGGTRLLLMLEWCVTDDGYAGFGNGFHANGGCGTKRAHMRHCVRLMHSIVSTFDETVLNDLTEQGAINQLVCLLEQFQLGTLKKPDRKLDDAIDVEMQCDLLVILSIICQFDVHRKDLFGNKGVDVINEYLRMDLRLLTSGLGHHRLLLCAIQAAWCTVVGSYMMEEYFLEKEGIFLLLDLLESSPCNMRGLLVGCLLDLMENQKSASHVSVWRGKDNSTAPHLFCELWREEERQLGVRREAHGVIADPENPLSPHSDRPRSVVSLPASCPSAAIVDVSENIRAKLYSIFSKIGFMELPGLATEDYVTLTIIEHYMDLKTGEVWTELLSELAEEQVRPVTPDREALEAITTAVHIRASQVVEVQREMLDAQKQQDLMDEQEYYARIRENHRQQERDMKNFADLISRTSKHSLLKAARQRQALSVDASRTRKHVKSPAAFHSTELQNINVTAFCQRHVAVESTPLSITGGALTNYDPKTGTIKRP
jgi:hypothetical protein